jgi:alcohol dehydrogenase (cytochrome c)
MRTLKSFLAASAVVFSIAAPAFVHAQSLDPADILKPKPDSWPTYSGDYTSRRFSPLTQINPTNVKDLSLAWTSRLASGQQGATTIVGGEGTLTAAGGGGGTGGIRGAILMVDDTLFVTAPDNIWSVDARDGHENWHYFWKTKGGTHTSNKGAAVYKDSVFVETADNYLLCLDTKTGKEKWHKVIASFDEQYFSAMAPVVVGNHLLVGTGNDLDEPGYIASYDPETGDQQWIFYTVPMKKGDPGSETWANIDAASHGGGNVWVPGAYDPETHLYVFGTGNPTAAYTSQLRGPGDNLYTCSLVALNVDTGKLAWYFQSSPHDTHDFDSAQTPVFVDAMFNGKPRKLALSAARNGYYFTLDRVTGEHLVTGKLSPDKVTWSMPELNKFGAPVRNPAKDNSFGGVLTNGSVTNYPPPAFNPLTNLFYVSVSENWHEVYLTTEDARGAMGLGGIQEAPVYSFGSYLTAMDYKTGKIVWRHKWPTAGGGGGISGLLTTASKLLFSNDADGNFVALDATNGTPLWHSHIESVSWPETYMLGKYQYILVASSDTLFAFRVN